MRSRWLIVSCVLLLLLLLRWLLCDSQDPLSSSSLRDEWSRQWHLWPDCAILQFLLKLSARKPQSSLCGLRQSPVCPRETAGFTNLDQALCWSEENFSWVKGTAHLQERLAVWVRNNQQLPEASNEEGDSRNWQQWPPYCKRNNLRASGYGWAPLILLIIENGVEILDCKCEFVSLSLHFYQFFLHLYWSSILAT